MSRFAWVLLAGFLCSAASTLLSARQPAALAQLQTPARAQSAQRPADALPAQVDASLIQKHCVACHNARVRTAGLDLSSLDPAHVAGAEATWEKVAVKLRTGSMPPPGRPRPAPADAASFIDSIERSLDRESAARPNPGRRLPLHRLNRAEYINAIRDLLDLEVEGRELLPTDDIDHGFDSMAGVLTVSPVLLERYLSAARLISRLAVGDTTLGPAVASRTYTLPPSLFQDVRMSEDLPFGSRGGAAIRHNFPIDGEYVLQVRLQRNYVDYVRGLGEKQRLQVRLDGKQVKTFLVGEGAVGIPAPESYAGNISGTADWEKFALAADEGLSVRLQVASGTRTVGVSFVDTPGEEEGILQQPQTGYALAVDESRSAPSGLPGAAVHSVTVDGPYAPRGAGDTQTRRAILICRPKEAREEDPCATRIFDRLATRAYRRPATTDDVRTLMGFFREGRAAGGFDDGVRRGLERLLVDPDFLFRIEHDPQGIQPGAAYRISDLELASRLSFFLWSSIPDDELRNLAATGRLKDPAVLEAQVRRMLRHPRASALVDNFASQWLSLRGLQASGPNPDLFPEFDENLRDAFRRETELFVGSQLQDDHSIADLLSADYTFVNERLARHYGIPNVYGSHFRRVQLTDPARYGLLGKGSILTVTSYGNRTSPVLRGHWLLDNILGTPPPPPPPNVPGLADKGEDGEPRSVRERMEQHRKNPACASCHVVMDPLGFALENFDAVGKWRTMTEAGTPVDPDGALPDGTAIAGLTGLRTHLLNHREQFVGTVADKLLTYAIGRGTEYFDRPALRKLTREAGGGNARWSALILGVVRSVPFQMRRAES